MKLKDIKLLKTKPGSELKAMLPGLVKELKELKLNGEPNHDIKYQIALIKTLCNN